MEQVIKQNPYRVAELQHQGVELNKRIEVEHPELAEMPWRERMEQKRRLMRGALGLPEIVVPSKLDPYTEAACLTCRDLGWVYASGTASAIPCPSCGGKIDRVAIALKHSGISEGARIENNLLSFKAPPEAPQWQSWASVCELVAENAFFVLMYGASGCGKSHLAYGACLDIARNQGKRVRFWQWPELLRELKACMDGQGNGDLLIEECIKVDTLALDDVGVRAGEQSPWRKEVLESIILPRYAEKRRTIVTCNEMEYWNMPEKIKSRFGDVQGAYTIHNTAPDYRKERQRTRPVTTG